MADIMTRSEFHDELSKIIAARPIFGAHYKNVEEPMGSTYSLTWERGWGAQATLHIRLAIRSEKDAHPKDLATMKTDVTWGSTTHDVSSARAAIDLYTEVVALQVLIENVLGRWKISSKETK
jgi:hypothetical protein